MLSQESVQLVHFLRERGIVSPELAERALYEDGISDGGRPITGILMELGVPQAAILAELAGAIGMRFVDLGEIQIDPAAVALVSDGVCRRLNCIPIAFQDEALVVAMSDPSNVVARDDLRAVTKRDIVVVLATDADIAGAINRLHRMEDSLDTITGELDGVAVIDAVEDISRAQELVDEAPVVKLVNLLITQAVNDRASDIHIEPQAKDVRVRFRIDGVLHEIMRSPKTMQRPTVSRIKIMADLNIAEQRTPQSGRISVHVGGRAVDLRVETLPTVHGEKIVMRVIDKSAGRIRLEDRGCSRQALDRYVRACHLPYGAVLVSGPTGSGKSTTLYSTLNLVNDVTRNIITIEDPVEQAIAGVSQIQVHQKAGMTFASALRSILRADPDIVMVGEIRDRETATIGIQAALTGHLVFSSIHTNDAPSVLTRLVEMGVEPFLVASALECAVAQRLARRLCERCREPYLPTVDALREASWPHIDALTELPTLYRPGGCGGCAKTGYHGRVAVTEVMLISEEVERLCCEHSSAEDIRKVALAEGMVNLREDGLGKAAAGITSIEEVLRVTA